ncbi:MAG: hypothetical protein GYB17_07780 [Gammaproteobacteria bacterium]|uniref:tetratricopeptide repeat protein n=1 Tax=Halomonas sp. EF61 TaxID=2950869 RepID=UPI0032DF4051|nr:hypothetical protein [Gammaproteobacteria bacterium]
MPWPRPLPTMATLIGLSAQALALSLWLAPGSVAATLPEGLIGSPIAQGFLLHCGGALALSFGLRRLGQPGDWRYFTTTTAALPVVGGLGLLLTSVIVLLPRQDDRQPAWRRHPMPPLPDSPVTPPDESGQALREGLASVLAQSRDSHLRQEALLQSQHLPMRTAISLMRRGLADDADDIRLLGYSMLNRLESQLEQRIAHLHQVIDKEGDTTGRAHEALACLYAEYAYLELAQGSACELMLKQALDSLDHAIDRAPSPERWRQRARLGLLQRRPQQARIDLGKAAKQGMPTLSMTTLSAELAYLERNTVGLREALTTLDDHRHVPPRLQSLREFWQ